MDSSLSPSRTQPIRREIRSNPRLVFSRVPKEVPSNSFITFKIFQVSELICAFLASASIFLAIIVTDLAKQDYKFDSVKSSATILLVLSSVSTLFLVIATIWRAFCEINWKKSKLLLSRLDNLGSSNRIYYLFFEILINSLHPLYGLHQTYFEHHNRWFDTTIHYSYNEVLSFFSLFKIYHLIRLLTILSSYRSSRSQRLCSINGVFAGNRYTLKCLIYRRPLVVLPLLLFSGVLVFSYGMYIFERAIEVEISFSLMGFFNCFWCIFITMTTVGFGDYYSVTTYGRVCGMLSCVYGLVILSVMVCTLSNKLKLTENENTCLKIIKVLEYKRQARKVAIRVINGMFVCKLKAKKEEKNKRETLSFVKELRELRKIRNKISKVFYSNTFGYHLENKLIYLESQNKVIEEKQKQIKELLLLNGFRY